MTELEEVCSGGVGNKPLGFEGQGDVGGHRTCTLDPSTNSETCTLSGGIGIRDVNRDLLEGEGGRTTCTQDLSTGDSICSGVGKRTG
jgi:hypothetical protein